jgi:membrane protease YdiL (CAAX protease family)
MQPIPSAALKAGLSAAAVVVILIRVKRSKRPPAWFGITVPPLLPTAAFIAVYILWMFGSNALTNWRGPWDFGPWEQAPLIASMLRVLAVCVFGPLVEEFIFRGVLFSWLQERMSIYVTIVATALSWSLLHYSYAWWVVGIIFVDGILLGLARWRTGSVFAPAAMHMLYNFYAIW